MGEHFEAMQRTMIQVGGGIIAALLASVVAAVAT
jgi:hypothetical protein